MVGAAPTDDKPAAKKSRRFRMQGFQLDEHPRALGAVILFVVLAVYAFVDIMLTAAEGYVSTPPYGLFALGGALLGILCYLWLYRGAVPRTEAAGLAAMIAVAFACSLYPGLLRIGSVAVGGKYQTYSYRLAAGLTLHPVDPSLPAFAAPLDRRYWRAQTVGDQWKLQMRRGLLGLWVYRVKPLADEIDTYNTTNAITTGVLQGIKKKIPLKTLQELRRKAHQKESPGPGKNIQQKQ